MNMFEDTVEDAVCSVLLTEADIFTHEAAHIRGL